MKLKYENILHTVFDLPRARKMQDSFAIVWRPGFGDILSFGLQPEDVTCTISLPNWGGHLQP